jgi:hypothetical protein
MLATRYATAAIVHPAAASRDRGSPSRTHTTVLTKVAVWERSHNAIRRSPQPSRVAALTRGHYRAVVSSTAAALESTPIDSRAAPTRVRVTACAVRVAAHSNGDSPSSARQRLPSAMLTVAGTVGGRKSSGTSSWQPRGPRRSTRYATARAAAADAHSTTPEAYPLMLRPVEVNHDGRWLPATLLATRLDLDGWHGLVGYTDPISREGFYRWCPEASLRDTAEQDRDRGLGDATPSLGDLSPDA